MLLGDHRVEPEQLLEEVQEKGVREDLGLDALVEVVEELLERHLEDHQQPRPHEALRARVLDQRAQREHLQLALQLRRDQRQDLSSKRAPPLRSGSWGRRSP